MCSRTFAANGEHIANRRRPQKLRRSSRDADSKSKKSKDNKDDEPPAIWDHSRDMAIGGRLMDEKQRQRIISDARSLGDRFGSGKGGGFL